MGSRKRADNRYEFVWRVRVTRRERDWLDEDAARAQRAVQDWRDILGRRMKDDPSIIEEEITAMRDKTTVLERRLAEARLAVQTALPVVEFSTEREEKALEAEARLYATSFANAVDHGKEDRADHWFRMLSALGVKDLAPYLGVERAAAPAVCQAMAKRQTGLPSTTGVGPVVVPSSSA